MNGNRKLNLSEIINNNNNYFDENNSLLIVNETEIKF